MEQIAANAERLYQNYKQVEYMTERLGQTYDQCHSGVTRWGLYVELNEISVRELPIRDLDDDYYEFDEKNYCLRGRRKNAHTTSATLSPSKWRVLPTWRKNRWTLH